MSGQSELSVGDVLQSGACSGASNAFDKLADFAIKTGLIP
ncbi:conjugative pilus assembly domain protein [Orientia tsutsugamushi str. Gilliam]|uniref:Conjugative pilus assembly domain protein n=1 Tax=Orientia tsutsugamushi str. Gilliam TaxID=1359184 RepID=A0A0F3MDS3_ORITS|nr:conjugative pilus assembly domain protein [Orientia tsutsugamushi str. Gilliam]